MEGLPSFMTEILTKDVITRSFEFYQDSFRDLNANHPQFQGFTEDEFTDAVERPSTVCAELPSAAGQIVVPQVVDIETFAWLKADFHERQFQRAADRGVLRQYHETPSVEPSERTVSEIDRIASEHGVLTYNFPSTDPEYPERLLKLIKAADAEVVEDVELAKQTYFMGQIRLKREHERREHPVHFAKAFDLARQDGSYAETRIKNGASLHLVVDDVSADVMYGFYKDAYLKLEDEPCEQGLSPDEFRRMMTEDKNVIKVVNSEDGEIVSLCLLENNLSVLSWVNEGYYASRYPDKHSKDQTYWFPGLAANPHKKGGLNTQVMVSLLAELVEKGDNEIAVVFDCGKTNTGFLDVFLNAMINACPQTEIDIQPIAHQNYRAISLKK